MHTHQTLAVILCLLLLSTDGHTPRKRHLDIDPWQSLSIHPIVPRDSDSFVRVVPAVQKRSTTCVRSEKIRRSLLPPPSTRRRAAVCRNGPTAPAAVGAAPSSTGAAAGAAPSNGNAGGVGPSGKSGDDGAGSSNAGSSANFLVNRTLSSLVWIAC
ncbi:hypothetical protein SCP_0704870 [Sparassis crispa]|uniref:Uncharacterized protein n=1 Tax=Sparassis crispa TaxID=139825 RepID=A0A401GSZ8_9APHY|nr:hypothetical protein SCP_0704870 [Sparassis crispa]GBE85300.1 hypothetical protein SCP_0704870 [Sparassis crispa]